MAAPVVPIQLASSVPMASSMVLTAGVPTSEPVRRTPPATVNRASSRMMNGMYSKSRVCSTSYAASEAPNLAAKGTRKARPQNAETLPK